MSTSVNKNNSKHNSLKFKIKNGDIITLTKEEATEILREFMLEDLDLFSNEEKLNLTYKMKYIVKDLEGYIENKFNKITENIIESITSHKVEEEIKRRVDETLRKIKEAL